MPTPILQYALRLGLAVLGIALTGLLSAAPAPAISTGQADPSGAAPARPLFGVIRWDGYNGSPALTQAQEFGFLKPEQFHWRAPWFVRPSGDPAHPLSFNPNYDKAVIQQVTDQENKYAADSGIDYWAFCYYAKYKGGWQLRDNFEAYLRSPLKNRIKFSLINICVHVGQGVPGKPQTPAVTLEDWHALTGEYVELMKDPAWVRVCGDRPLFFMFVPQDLSLALGDVLGTPTKLAEAVKYFRDQAHAAGLANPYIVGMEAGGIWAAVYVDKAGLDAVSAYRGTFGATPAAPPFTGMWPAIKTQFLENPDMGKGRKVIVPLASGADQAPRTPGLPTCQEPRPGDLAAMVKNAFDYVVAHPDQCEARAVLMYAWNEHSEGGFLCPLMGAPPDYKPNTARLDDLACGLKEWTPQKP